MCFSAEVSLLTFTIGTVFSILIFQFDEPSYKIFAGYLFYISLMQFIEFLLWRHQICDDYNRRTSIAGMFLSHLQPIVLAILMVTLYKQSSNMKLYILVISILYLFFIIPYSMKFLKDEGIQCTLKKGNPHLIWNWNNNNDNKTIIGYIFYFIAVMSLLLFGIPNKKLAYVFSTMHALTLITSYIFYPRQYFGSIWCFYGSLVPPFVFLYKILTDYIK
jgi:hypothetical protein